MDHPPIANLCDVLKDTTRPAFLFGSVPPREGTTVESAKVRIVQYF